MIKLPGPATGRSIRTYLQVKTRIINIQREIFEYYRQALVDVPGIEFMPEAPYGRSNQWLTVILISPEEFGANRETIRLALEAENIESRPIWKPMHLQPVFQVARREAQGPRLKGNAKDKIKAKVVGGEVAEDLFNRGLCLPSGTAMTEEDLDRVVEVIMRYGAGRREGRGERKEGIGK